MLSMLDQSNTNFWVPQLNLISMRWFFMVIYLTWVKKCNIKYFIIKKEKIINNLFELHHLKVFLCQPRLKFSYIFLSIYSMYLTTTIIFKWKVFPLIYLLNLTMLLAKKYISNTDDGGITSKTKRKKIKHIV